MGESGIWNACRIFESLAEKYSRCAADRDSLSARQEPDHSQLIRAFREISCDTISGRKSSSVGFPCYMPYKYPRSVKNVEPTHDTAITLDYFHSKRNIERP